MSTQPASPLIAFLLALAPVFGGDPVFVMEDPGGDDNGAGTISYPSGVDYAIGDLDLVSFSAENTRGGTWFTARFANPVRDPGTRTSRFASQPLRDIVDHDFYTLNIDVYIDTDGEKGSGNTRTLPGRRVVLSEDTAWEKSVLVTPRPSVAESMLRTYMTRTYREEREQATGSLSRPENQAIRGDVRDLVEDRFHFSDRIRIRGRELSFFAPEEFLGGPVSPEWRYLVLITGADPEQRTELPIISDGKSHGLMMLAFNEGRPFECFRTEVDSDPEQPRVIDALYPTVEQQVELLANFDAVNGVEAVLPAIAPSQDEIVMPPPARPIAAAKQRMEVKKASELTPEERKMLGLDEKPKADELLEQSPAAKKKGKVEKRSVAERLRELETLLKEGLITKDEYQALRKKILEEL